MNEQQEMVWRSRYQLKDATTGEPLEHSIEDTWQRVARAIAQAESPQLQQHWQDKFYELLSDFKFLPGGRILSSAGAESENTLLNCLAGETLVHTDKGVFPIKELSGYHNVLSVGRVYRKAFFRDFGTQPLWEVTLSTGDTFRATEDHNWVAITNQGNLKFTPTWQLEGETIPINPRPYVDDPEQFRKGVQHGIVFGDGSIGYTRKRTGDDVGYVLLIGRKRELEDWFAPDYPVTNRCLNGHESTRCVKMLPGYFKQIPNESDSPAYWRGFIAGLLATDGNVGNKGGAVIIFNKSLDTLQTIRERAVKAGIVCASVLMKRERSPYDNSVKPCYGLTIYKDCLQESDILRSHHKQHWKKASDNKRTSAKVVSVKPLGVEETVYCCFEPETHTITIGAGYLTGQCFTIDMPEDSRLGIFKRLEEMVEIEARGGGVGINMSSLRPEGSVLSGNKGVASGPIPWCNLFSLTSGEIISQYNQRRGALWIGLNDTHPDVFEFVKAKVGNSKLQYANISVLLSAAFMEAVERDADWNLWFGETTYRCIKARELFDFLCECAWKSGDPGVVFVDTVNKFSNSWWLGNIYQCNPCGEQPLPPYGSCCLGSLNLSKYVKNKQVDWGALDEDAATAVRFLDNVLDVTNYPTAETERIAKEQRRIGLGTTGLADMLLMLGLKYGSPESIEMIDRVYACIACAAYETSAKLADEKGRFPAYDAEKFNQSEFVKNLPISVASRGVRNMTLLTQPPCGSISLMANCSSGIEPVFSWQTRRKDRLGERVIYHPIYEQWASTINHDEQPAIPEYFVTAHEIDPLDRVKVQATIQRWTDSSISSTVNLPEDATVEEVKQVYLQAWRSGCKGITVFREGSREGVLSDATQKQEANKDEGMVSQETEQSVQPCDTQESKVRSLSSPQSSNLAVATERPDSPLPGLTYRVRVPLEDGDTTNVYITITGIDGKPVEVFLNSGASNRADHDIIARLVSHSLRSGVPLEEVIDNCWKVRGYVPLFTKGCKKPITCVANAIGYCLENWLSDQPKTCKCDAIESQQRALFDSEEEYLKVKEEMEQEGLKPVVKELIAQGMLCPQCGAYSVVKQSGCPTCTNCAWSKCG
jgi:ribonucleoside-diphosphate reductase alpha chain